MVLKLSVSTKPNGPTLAETPLLNPIPPRPHGLDEKIIQTVHGIFYRATDPVVFGSMLAAQGTFGLSRLALARMGGTLLAANGTAFGLEGLAFAGSERILNRALDRPNDSEFGKNLAHTYLSLGLLKGLSGVAASTIGRPVVTQLAALGGVYLSHTLAPYLHLANAISPSERLFQSAVTLLDFAVTGSLLHRIPGYARAQQEIQLETHRAFQQSWKGWSDRVFSIKGDPELAWVSGSNPAVETQSTSLLRKAGEGKGGGQPNQGPDRSKLGVKLPASGNAESFLALLEHLKRQYPEEFGHIEIPPLERVPKLYPNILAQVESARVNSPRRIKIAQCARDWVLDQFKFAYSGGRTTSLREAVRDLVPEAITAEERKFLPESVKLLDQSTTNRFKAEEALPPNPEAGPGYRAIIRHKGVVYDTLGKILNWTQEQLDAGKISPMAAQKINLSAREAYSKKAELEGRHGYFRFPNNPETKAPKKVVIVSGGAELSPLKFFTEAGAKVLVIDLTPLGEKVKMIRQAPGGLYQYQANLLTDLPQIASVISTFAGEDKVHLGFYPYASGLVWLLSAASEAVHAAVASKVATTFTLRSPSVVAEVPEATAAISEKRWSTQTFRNLGRLFTKNMKGEKDQGRVAQATVVEQRLPYAVGNWLGKTIFSEARLGDDPDTFALAPVGPIAFTKSMEGNKMIVTALKSAHLFGVDVVPPYTSRDIQAFLFYDHFKKTHPYEAGGLPDKIIDWDGTQWEQDPLFISDHADLGLFAQGNALGSLVYPAGILGMLGRDSRKLLPEGLIKQKAGTYIAPEDSTRLQGVLRKLKGPLALSFAKEEQRFTALMAKKNSGDQIHLTIEDGGQLTSIRLQKPNDEVLEYDLDGIH